MASESYRLLLGNGYQAEDYGRISSWPLTTRVAAPGRVAVQDLFAVGAAGLVYVAGDGGAAAPGQAHLFRSRSKQYPADADRDGVREADVERQRRGL